MVGLGGGFDSLHKYLEEPIDVAGSGRVVKVYTGRYRGVKLPTIAVAGGPDAERAVAVACARRVKALVGVGWCGSLDESMDVGDVVVPVAAVRDEDTTDHHIDKRYPAVPDFELAHRVLEAVRRLGSVRVHAGMVITTSSAFTENPEWAREWSSLGVLAVDCETSAVFNAVFPVACAGCCGAGR